MLLLGRNFGEFHSRTWREGEGGDKKDLSPPLMCGTRGWGGVGGE